MKLKKLLLKKSLLLILYLLIYAYFILFNWQVFTTTLNINLGFGVVTIPPFILLFLLGFIIIGILSWISYISSLQRTIYELEQGVELGKMKDKLIRSKIREYFSEGQNVELLRAQLGIQELIKRQEELASMIQKLSEANARGTHVSQKDQSQTDN